MYNLTYLGFSNLMKDHPDQMTSALLTHNNLIRKAKWANFGFTVEQEGGTDRHLMSHAVYSNRSTLKFSVLPQYSACAL